MEYFEQDKKTLCIEFNSSLTFGLSSGQVELNKNKYGKNQLQEKKKKGVIKKVLSALNEPMLIILLFSFLIAVGSSIGQFLKTGNADFSECLGILFAIFLSVFITLIMEGSSEKAFKALSKIYEKSNVNVIRNGKTTMISQDQLVVGDIVKVNSGDKIFADGKIIESNALSADESALTGESVPLEKFDCEISRDTPLAERKNCLYSGTFITNGSGKYIVTAVGDNTEIGKIAQNLKEKKESLSPLNQKMAKLGKTVTIIGGVSAILVFVFSLVRLYFIGNLNFNSVQSQFISCIVLIVAAVPEGLPTIVAVSLALNMIKLAKENALIKKMIAVETTGAVSVICSDKTGTLTKNKMQVASVYTESLSTSNSKIKDALIQNFIINSTCDISYNNRTPVYFGSGTECAILDYAINKLGVKDYKGYRKNFKVIDTIPFDSNKKYMTTTILVDGKARTLIKGAPEIVIEKLSCNSLQKANILKKISISQKKAERVLLFAHSEKEDEFIFDGFVSLKDPVREDVYKSIKECKKAGVKVKILTGDNLLTAFAIAKELKIADNETQVINAFEIDKMDDITLKKLLPKITVIARSTPMTKLRVVKALKELGEVVAVTGDGINDAPAIKHADVGIAMGISGSEITKEAADIVLLDDSFSTIVRAVSFGRNVYCNLQRFILFQLSVNVSALIFIVVLSVLGKPSPFNTLQLLWINVIMDGPPALTLGLEKAGKNLMNFSPVKREKSIVGKNMLLRILFNGIFISAILLLQYKFNFLKVKESEFLGAIFLLFTVFQLFNAFNSRELGATSIFKNLGKNKIMILTFLLTFLVQVLICQLAPNVFGISSLSFLTYVKILALGSSIIFISELYKLIYRRIVKR